LHKPSKPQHGTRLAERNACPRLIGFIYFKPNLYKTKKALPSE